MLIPRLIDNVKARRPISLQGEQGIRINAIHVFDSVEVLKNAVEIKKSCTINIAGPDLLSIRQIGDIIGKPLNSKTIYKILPTEPRDLFANISTMQEQLWSPRISLKDGIKELL